MLSTGPASREGVERQVLEILGGLLSELGGAVPKQPALDDLLDRDLGVGSLERVELLLRLERTFGVRLADAVMADANDAAALVSAVMAAGLSASLSAGSPAGLASPTTDQSTEGRAPLIPEDAMPGVSAPLTARTLVDVLAWHAARTPNRTHLILRKDDGTEVPVTYGALATAAHGVAAGLRARGVGPGARVVLMLRTEEAFFSAFLGTLVAGAVPVPIYPPIRADRMEEFASRQRAIVSNAGARVLITFGEAARLAGLIKGQVPTLDHVTTVDELIAGGHETERASPATEDAALIQYTSGSTGTPKGVLLSHANLLANIRAIGQGVAVGPTDVAVSWLPLYHDMGLIGAWLAPLYFGVPVVIMSPLAFLARPARWLWSIHAHRGTLSAAPNFAYDLAARKIADEEIKGLDLSGWRLALNGSEMVSPDTIARFTERFAPYGFRPETMCPVFGLAECSVGLTASPLGQPPRVDRIARDPFTRTREVRPAQAADPAPLSFVSVGRALPEHDVRIIDAEGTPVGDRQEGHIVFRGPSVTSGYFGNPDATAAMRRGDWMDSGDLGYMADGDLFITGREKDLIIQAGRNVSAQEVEDLAASVEGVRQGCVAAFGVHDAARGTERLVVVAETRAEAPDARERLRQAILDRVVDRLGTPPDVVVIAGPGAVLKTSSGKIRRSATRDAYVAGTLGQRASVGRQWAGLLAASVGDRARRIVRTLGRVAYTAWVLAMLGLTLPFMWVALHLTRSDHAARRVVAGWARLILALVGARPRVIGIEHLRGLGSGLLAANHASYMDPLVLMAAVPLDVLFAAKGRLVEYTLLGTVIRKCGYVRIERTNLSERLAGADAVTAALADGARLMVFPEGTFAMAPGLLPFRLGAFRAAVETGRPVVPVAIRGTRHVLPSDTWLCRPGPITVVIGQPLEPSGDGWPEMVRLRDATHEFIARESGEASLQG